MLQFSLGDDFALVATEPAAAPTTTRFKDLTARLTNVFTVAPTREPVTTAPIEPIQPAPVATVDSACLPGDAMSEFGCITPKVLGPGATAVNSYYVCPPNSTPYSDMWCLRTPPPKTAGLPTAQQMTYETPPQQQQPAPPVMTMYVCSDGTRVSDPSTCPVVATETVATEPEPTDGSGQSPGMQVTPSPPPMPGPEDVSPMLPVAWTAEQERKRWMKWATIGGVALVAGTVFAILRR